MKQVKFKLSLGKGGSGFAECAAAETGLFLEVVSVKMPIMWTLDGPVWPGWVVHVDYFLFNRLYYTPPKVLGNT